MTISTTESESTARGSQNFGSAVRVLSSILLWFLALTSIAGTAYVVTNRIHFARVLSGSMVPVFDRGDVLLLKPVDRSTIRQGQIVMLPLSATDSSLYSHRIIWVEHKGNQTFVRTKGDANPVADPHTLRITSRQVPLVTGALNMSWAPMLRLNKGALLALFALLLALFGWVFVPVKSHGHHRK